MLDNKSKKAAYIITDTKCNARSEISQRNGAKFNITVIAKTFHRVLDSELKNGAFLLSRFVMTCNIT